MTMTPLFYGGFVFCVNSQSKIYKNQNTLYGYVLDNNFRINSTIDIPENFTLPSFNQAIGNKAFYRSYGFFPHNNTFIGIMPNVNDSTNWQIVSAEITRFLPDGKNIFYIFE